MSEIYCYGIILRSFNLFHHIDQTHFVKQVQIDSYNLNYDNNVFLIVRRYGRDIMITAYQEYNKVLQNGTMILPILNESGGPCMNTLRILERLYCECYQIFCEKEDKIAEDWCLQETMVSWLDNISTVRNDHELHYFNVTLPVLISPWKWKVHEENTTELKIGLEHDDLTNDSYLMIIKMAPFNQEGHHEVMVHITWLPDSTETYYYKQWDEAIGIANDLLEGHCRWNNITLTTWHALNQITKSVIM